LRKLPASILRVVPALVRTSAALHEDIRRT
jgi:hypothetical protein